MTATMSVKRLLSPSPPQSQPSSPTPTSRVLSVEVAVDSAESQVSLAGEPENTDSEHQSPKRIEPSPSFDSAEESSSKDLFVNYPPNRHRFNINGRHHSTCLSYPSSSPSCKMNCFRPPMALQKSIQLLESSSPLTKGRFTLLPKCETSAQLFSKHFPDGHQLDAQFVEAYHLQDELGAGGYGFVMTALDRYDGLEVAVKFIIKDKVPEHAWIHDPTFGKLPMEVVLLSFVNHESVVKCLDVFEDPVYFYLVQELHGSPWNRSEGYTLDWPMSGCSDSAGSPTSFSTPSLSPSTSETSLSLDSPRTPVNNFLSLPTSSFHGATSPSSSSDDLLRVDSEPAQKHEICTRSSYDLFECIEQSDRKHLTEEQARYVFSQVVEAVYYLDNLGIAHRDIKDENLVIDHNLKIKLIDFGSATIVDPTKPRPEYDQFYGTAAYASSEILLKKRYKAAPAEVWTLGVLLSYLLAGVSPFPTIRDAVDGKIYLSESLGLKPSETAMELIRACLDPNPDIRLTVAQIREHPWMHERGIPVDV